ncbi:SRPBCC domain-containing protein [Pollutibacter soli]|uniref:SRPBCC domain-containing protein n=1 Tax=Pollutibacter soli TaxID=3034157 RepID=UPI00301335BC
MSQQTTNTRIIRATAEKIYEALTNPDALKQWQVPGDMTAKIHRFDLREGGGYEMSLFYPESESAVKGKTSTKEDRFTARYLKLIPDKKILQAIDFQSDDPAFSGEMILEINLEEVADGTKVSFHFTNIPAGINPADNEEGTRESLEKLAVYIDHSSE